MYGNFYMINNSKQRLAFEKVVLLLKYRTALFSKFMLFVSIICKCKITILLSFTIILQNFGITSELFPSV